MLTAQEQYSLELANRARLDPLAEAGRFGIDLNAGLAPGTLTGAARQVLAPNALLDDAAQGHSDWMSATGSFSHTGAGGSSAGDRITDAGFVFRGAWSWGENLALSWTTGPLDPTAVVALHHEGLFESASHRVNLLDGGFRELGVGQTLASGQQIAHPQTGQPLSVNASYLTHNFAKSGSSVFITGVVYDDTDGDAFYSVGEGRGGLDVATAGQAAQSAAAGGYALRLAASAAPREVTFDTADGPITVSVSLAQGNVKLDLVDGVLVQSSADLTLAQGAGAARLLGVGDLSLTGNDGDNLLYLNRGNNRVEGGDGHDIAVFAGRQADFDIAETAAGLLVSDRRGGVESQGTDLLTGVELLRFDDGEITFAVEAAPAAAAPPPPGPPVVALSGHVGGVGGIDMPGLTLHFRPDDPGLATVSGQNDGQGAFVLEVPAGTPGRLVAELGAPSGGVISVADALEVLRLSVGLRPGDDPLVLLAADVNADGRVGVNDALDILRHATGLGGGTVGEVLFVETDAAGGVAAHAGGVHLADAALLGTLDLQAMVLGDLSVFNTV